jgi:hypothetical protein
MRRALGRASIALEQKGQKLGALRYMSLDVKQLEGVAELNAMPTMSTESIASLSTGIYGGDKQRASPPPPRMPPAQPQKITVGATVQCAFQIQ